MAEIPAKIMRPAMSILKIGTHNGTFHCDEVLACSMLKILPQYKNADIIRTRDSSTLDACDIVVDVGGTFDAARHRYDHHQRGFDHCMNSLNPEYAWTTKLSSAGLVYFHFGHQVLSNLLCSNPGDEITKVIFEKIYEGFIEEVDGIDNGISACEDPLYHISTNLSSRVSHLNPAWNEKGADFDDKFHKAMALVKDEFIDRVLFYKNSWWPARVLVVNAINKRYDVDPSGEILCFSSGGMPWKDHLLTLESSLELKTNIKFVLYPDENAKWRVQCVPEKRGSFENRLSLLKEWRGLRDDQLSKISGIDGCVFVHISGFIGGNTTYEGALQMAKRTLIG